MAAQHQMPPPPDAFTNELGQWIKEKCTGSIFCVEFRPKDPSRVKERWDFISPISPSGPLNLARLTTCQQVHCCTGSVVHVSNEGHLDILTCAHVLEFLFNAAAPISPAMINDLYRIYVLCDHEEQRYQIELLNQQNQGGQFQGQVIRNYIRARATYVRCSKDLLVLRATGDIVQNCCQTLHRALNIARTFPSRLMDVVMLSWPPQSSRTAVQGRVSNPSRPYSALSRTNPHGYNMKLAEVDITSESGSSGAPLLNGAGDYVGILHGGNVTFSYYVSLDDLKETFRSWGVMSR